MLRATTFILLYSTALTDKYMDEVIIDLNTFNTAIYNVHGFVRKKNLICFPLPILSTLSVIYHGAEGQSAKEISDILQSVSNPQGYDSVITSLKNSTLTTISFRNGLYLKPGTLLNEHYKKMLKAYSVDMKFMSFDKLSEMLKDKITLPDWDYRKSLSEDARGLLVSRAEFRSPWHKPFLVSETSTGTFLELNKEQSDIPMMNMRNVLFKWTYSTYLESTIIEIPLAGKRLSMIVILPVEEDGLQSNIVSKLYDTSTILAIVSKMRRKFLRRVSIPKFGFQKQMSLKPLVYELQIKEIFTDKSNFSGATTVPVYVDQGLHTAIVEVTERGVRSGSHVLTVIKDAPILKQRSVTLAGPDLVQRPTRKPIQRPTTKKPTQMATFRTKSGFTRSTPTRGPRGKREERESRAYSKSEEFVANHPFAFLLFDYHLNMIISFGKFSNSTEQRYVG